MKTATAFVVLAFLFAVGVKGLARIPKGRCFCADKGVNVVQPKLIEKVEIIPPSRSCENREIMVTLKNSSEVKCLNPESKYIQNYIRKVLARSQRKEQPTK